MTRFLPVAGLSQNFLQQLFAHYLDYLPRDSAARHVGAMDESMVKGNSYV